MKAKRKIVGTSPEFWKEHPEAKKQLDEAKAKEKAKKEAVK